MNHDNISSAVPRISLVSGSKNGRPWTRATLHLINDHQCSFFVQPGDAFAIKDALKQVSTTPDSFLGEQAPVDGKNESTNNDQGQNTQ